MYGKFIWDSKCICDIIWLQDSKRFQDTYKKKGGKLLLERMQIRDRKFISNTIWFQVYKRFQDIYKKKDKKLLLNKNFIQDRICLQDIVGFHDWKWMLGRKSVWDEIWLEGTKIFQDIYRERDGKLLFDSMQIWDIVCI